MITRRIGSREDSGFFEFADRDPYHSANPLFFFDRGTIAFLSGVKYESLMHKCEATK